MSLSDQLIFEGMLLLTVLIMITPALIPTGVSDAGDRSGSAPAAPRVLLYAALVNYLPDCTDQTASSALTRK